MEMANKTELIWVDKEFAKIYRELDQEKATTDEKVKAFSEYLDGIKNEVRTEFKLTLEGLEEDSAIFTGLMLRVKQAFESAKKEHYQSSYELWENFDKEIPSIKEKTEKIIATLDPLAEKLTQINDLLGKIQTWNFDKLIETVEKFASLYGNSKDMVEFLVNNFTPKEEAK